VFLGCRGRTPDADAVEFAVLRHQLATCLKRYVARETCPLLTSYNLRTAKS
jgi:hypothetical protein